MIKQVYRFFMSENIRYKVYKYRSDKMYKHFKNRFLSYSLNSSHSEINPEIEEVAKFVKTSDFVPVFPYEFTKNYNFSDIEVFFDVESGLKYVHHNKKRLYFKRSWSDEKIKRSYNCLQIEQDAQSPHLYLTEDFIVENGSVVVDAGAGEGNFSLDVIEKVSKVYIFERDLEWIEAITATFYPWKEKVQIINKYIGNRNDEVYVTLDTFFENKKIDFLKIDVDGGEWALLQGSQKLLKENRIGKISICTYHKQDDGDKFLNFLQKFSFENFRFSDGYMFFLEDLNQKPPYVRRGVLRIS